MRKFLSVIALAIVTVGLILGGILVFVHYGKLSEGLPPNMSAIDNLGTTLGLGIALFVGGIGAGVATIANFFTARTRDK